MSDTPYTDWSNEHGHLCGTPRTDAALIGATQWGRVKTWTCKGKPIVYADFARQLERENAELRKDKERLLELLSQHRPIASRNPSK